MASVWHRWICGEMSSAKPPKIYGLKDEIIPTWYFQKVDWSAKILEKWNPTLKCWRLITCLSFRSILYRKTLVVTTKYWICVGSCKFYLQLRQLILEHKNHLRHHKNQSNNVETMGHWGEASYLYEDNVGIILKFTSQKDIMEQWWY